LRKVANSQTNNNENISSLVEVKIYKAILGKKIYKAGKIVKQS